jgi:hypothetical protein
VHCKLLRTQYTVSGREIGIFTTFEIYIAIFRIGVDSALKSLHSVDMGSVANVPVVYDINNFSIQTHIV